MNFEDIESNELPDYVNVIRRTRVDFAPKVELYDSFLHYLVQVYEPVTYEDESNALEAICDTHISKVKLLTYDRNNPFLKFKALEQAQEDFQECLPKLEDYREHMYQALLGNLSAEIKWDCDWMSISNAYKLGLKNCDPSSRNLVRIASSSDSFYPVAYHNNKLELGEVHDYLAVLDGVEEYLEPTLLRKVEKVTQKTRELE